MSDKKKSYHGVANKIRKHGKAVVPLFFLVSTILMLASCGAGSEGQTAAGDPQAWASEPMSAARSGDAVKQLAGETGANFNMAAEGDSARPDPDASPTTAPDEAERKLVSTGTMELEVDDLQAAESSMRAAVQETGGYVEYFQQGQDNFRMNVKVPADSFDAFMDDSSALGEVLSRGVNVEDVTDRYYDLEHRVRSKEILVERFQGYLEEAEKIEDVLTVERELNETIAELERLKGSFRNLSHLVSFSTLRLDVQLPSYASEKAPLPSLRAGLRNFGYTIANVFYGIFFVVLGLIVFGVPALLILGLLYWISFGKIGLLRRFFQRLHPENSSSGSLRRRKKTKGTSPEE